LEHALLALWRGDSPAIPGGQEMFAADRYDRFDAGSPRIELSHNDMRNHSYAGLPAGQRICPAIVSMSLTVRRQPATTAATSRNRNFQ
jgi:hypothetical protein